LSGGRGKGTNDENDHLRNKNLRKSIIDNKNTEKRIFVRICFSFYVFKQISGGKKEVGAIVTYKSHYFSHVIYMKV
jgi:hypothetical protein